jgi:hypothetical protein
MATQMIRKFLLPAMFTAAMAAGCVVGGARVGVVASGPDYYDGYYDGFYGPFNDGYWGNDGFFWYSDANHGFHRDDQHHFQRAAGNGGTWNHVHGSGTHRDH